MTAQSPQLSVLDPTIEHETLYTLYQDCPSAEQAKLAASIPSQMRYTRVFFRGIFSKGYTVTAGFTLLGSHCLTYTLPWSLGPRPPPFRKISQDVGKTDEAW